MNVRVLSFVLICAGFPGFVHAALVRDLSFGDAGADVRELQILLNARGETQIAEHGPGSPGNETSYFGPLTEAAVLRFQTLHAAKILYPLGLSSPTGYVGAATRAVLGNGSPTSESGMTVPRRVTTINPYDNTTTSEAKEGRVGGLFDEGTEDVFASALMNADALPDMIAAMRAAGLKEGRGEDELVAAEEAIRDVFENTSDAELAELVAQAQDAEPITTTEELFDTLDFIEEKLEAEGVVFHDGARPLGLFFAQIFGMKTAHAQLPSGGVLDSFGGKVSAIAPCTCTFGFVWQVTVVGAKPGLFNYVIGTQFFLNHNLPLEGVNTLGWQSSLGSAICIMGAPPACSSVPATGVITPIVGTSLIPST